MSTVGQAQSPARHSAKWQERFNFFETYGAPNDPRFKAGLKSLPGVRRKLWINLNVIAYFFGPIYFFVLGLWKKGLALIGMMLATNALILVVCTLLGTGVPYALGGGLTAAYSLMYALTVNYSYYLKEMKGEQGWNPFKGMRL
ncbi:MULTISPECIES: DUF2628 domain-containing protein [Pseudomonas syringae group]|uniref:DUF2628 domain-containing protein n=1 Tax=Pseudomonas syringae pv. ribicola TaxID=55398 RepID=A0A3M2VJE9_PSESI|nr:DUF2628 domain-containing protein [Pseudomonas syringae group genomosp. 3]POD68588.1 hypothetical protein BKM17_26745 [Pseudomonas syringae group genomosp. 3]RML39411.1 hypothetical protein ALQ95_01865 [Pseudomonas syringae pv. ribicola]